MMARIISLCHDYYSLRSRTPISPYHQFLFASLFVQIKFCVVYDDGIECCSFLLCDCYGGYGSKCYCCSRTDPFKITNCNCTKNRDYVKKEAHSHTHTHEPSTIIGYRYELGSTLFTYFNGTKRIFTSAKTMQEIYSSTIVIINTI